MKARITALLAAGALAVTLGLAACGQSSKPDAEPDSHQMTTAPAAMAGDTAMTGDPKARAEKQITNDNVDQELEKLKAEIQGDN